MDRRHTQLSIEKSEARGSRGMAATKHPLVSSVAVEMLANGGSAADAAVAASFAIGVVEPTSIFIDTYDTSKVGLSDGEIAKKVAQLFDMRPFAIEERLKLRNPIYLESAAYGHMGKEPQTVTKVFESPYNGKVEKEVELFTWEKLDRVEEVKKLFNL